jgi:hypothetical protein
VLKQHAKHGTPWDDDRSIYPRHISWLYYYRVVPSRLIWYMQSQEIVPGGVPGEIFQHCAWRVVMVTRILPAKDVAVRAAGFEGTGRECEWRIEGNQGLVLAVMAPGRSGASSKIWRAYYSLTRDGRRTVRKLRLGAYPRVGLAEARRRAAEVSEAVERGQDPVGEARATKADLARQSLTFGLLAELSG